MAMLYVRALSKSFSSEMTIRGFKRVSFSIQSGEALGLVGESGCGKTTLARTILRLIVPDEGEIWFQGRPWLKLRGSALREARRGMQAIFQDPDSSLNPLMTNRAIVEEPLRIHRLGSRKQRLARALELLKRVGLSEEIIRRKPGELSGGQKQRLALARALATEPSLLIADEPLSALDLSIQLQILSLLSNLRREQDLAILFISHSIGAAHHLCDRIAVMRSGRLVELAPTRALFNQPKHPYTKFLIEGFRSGSLPSGSDKNYGADSDEWREVEEGHWVLEPPSNRISTEDFRKEG